MKRLFPIGIPVVLVWGMYEVEIHMLLILSPIVLAGGLIDDALTTRHIYRNRMLRVCQDTKYFFKTVRDGVEPSSPARNSRETTCHVYQFRHLTRRPLFKG